jgi:uncharacterized protein YndB with AHSA1/START domain
MNTITQPVSLKISRLIKASRERVFAAWTNPNELPVWIGCGTRPGQSATIDLRVGGEYHLRMNSEECGEVHIHGIYQVINPPSRLVFTWQSVPCEPMTTPTLVTLDLIERKEGTEVQLTHEGFSTPDACDKHNNGWNSSLDNLAKLV